MEKSFPAAQEEDPKLRKRYRERAVEMLKLARKAHTDDARSAYINLAASWDALDKQGGHSH